MSNFPETWPLWSLEEFRQELSYHPFHFWQLANSSIPVTSACNDAVYQHRWQNADSAGREDIAAAILDAESQLREFMKFSFLPHYVIETVDFPKWFDQRVTRYDYAGSDNRWLSIQLKETKIRSVGVETFTVISAASVAVYTDEDSDGLDDTFTLGPLATTVTDPDQIEVYFKVADRLDSDDIGERWRIKPIKVSISGGNVTIKGKAWLCTKPILYEGASQNEIDPSISGNFVTDLMIYRHWYNPDGITVDTCQAKLIWETLPYPEFLYGYSGSPIDTTSDPAAEGYAIARCGIKDSENGIVNIGPGVYNATSGIWSSTTWAGIRPPDRAIIRYQAGESLQNGQMARKWRRVLLALAAANLKSPICSCVNANKELAYWQFDLARAVGSDDESYAFDPTDFKCPWGTRRGHIYAWSQVKYLANTRGFSVG